jgi:hypothetical protein
MAAETGTEGLAAADKNTRLARTVTGRTATLLLAELCRRAVDFAARLGLVCTLLALVELPLYHTVNNVSAWIKTENRFIQIN